MFQNPWFVGISGSIISSLIVLTISYTINKLSQNEYFKRVEEANGEVISIFRQIISEDDFPNKNIIESVINATSRKFKVKSEDMNNGQMVIENLITEIFASNFISVDKKLINSNNLLKIKSEYDESNLGLDKLKRVLYLESSSRSYMTSAFLYVVIFVVIVLLSNIEKNKDFIELTKIEILPMAIVLLTPILLACTFFLNRRKKDSESDENKNKLKDYMKKFL